MVKERMRQIGLPLYVCFVTKHLNEELLAIGLVGDDGNIVGCCTKCHGDCEERNKKI